MAIKNGLFGVAAYFLCAVGGTYAFVGRNSCLETGRCTYDLSASSVFSFGGRRAPGAPCRCSSTPQISTAQAALPDLMELSSA